METLKPVKKKLSKSILEMKFMKRSKEKFYKEQDEELGKAMFASEVTEAMKSGGSKIVIEPSFVPCVGLIVGRLSYHGMNPEIEKLMDAEREPEETKKEENKEVEISDAEMAHRYSTLVGTIANKYKKKNNKRVSSEPAPSKKPKFLKPSDD